MNARHAVLSVLTCLPLLAGAARADEAPSFDQLANSDFRALRAAAPAAPAAAETRVPGDDRGVFLFSNLAGRIAFCSVAGCRTIAGGGVSTVVRSASGLYFTGPEGTGYCSPLHCDVLAPSVSLQLTLNAGPAGDVYGIDKEGVWHCTPASCARAYSGPLGGGTNYLSGVYKANGDFVGSEASGTFWCSNGVCRRVKNSEILLVEDRCGGPVPQDVSYGFWGRKIFRCTPNGCAAASSDDASVDNYVSCAFDAQGRLHVPARPAGSVVCGETCRVDASDAAAYPAVPRSSNDEFNDVRRRGTDGAVYSLAGFDKIPAPAAKDPQRLPPSVSRAGAAGSLALPVDPAFSCASWWTSAPGDEDEDGGDRWELQCRLLP